MTYNHRGILYLGESAGDSRHEHGGQRLKSVQRVSCGRS